MVHANSSSKILKFLAIALLLVVLLLPTSAFAEETQIDATTSVEGATPVEASVEPEAVLYDASVSGEGTDGQEIQTMTSEQSVDEPVMMEDTANTNGEVTDDLKRSVTMISETGAPAAEGTSSTQNIILYSVIGALAGVIAVLGVMLYRKRQS